MKLDEIRRRIDKIDRELLVLLQERMGLAIQSKKFKAQVADLKREEAVLARAERMNLALVEQSFARQLLQTIIEESKRLQEQDRQMVAFQGEHGAYGEVAARRLVPDGAFIPCLEFVDVFQGVEEARLVDLTCFGLPYALRNDKQRVGAHHRGQQVRSLASYTVRNPLSVTPIDLDA